MTKCATRNCRGSVEPRYGFNSELADSYEEKYSCDACGAIYIKRIKKSETANAGAMPAK